MTHLGRALLALVQLRKGTKQVVTVNRTEGYHARVTGLVLARKRVQGSGKTPLGTHRLPWAFGMRGQKDRWDPSYRKVRKGGFRWRLPASHPDGSERLKDYPKQYEYSVVTSFNAHQVRHRGGAIFLHVNGSGATAGCVSAPRWFLRRLMVHLDQDRVPVIAIGR